MSAVDESVINDMKIVYKPILKLNKKFINTKIEKKAFHFFLLPDYKEAIIEAEKEKPISKEILKNANKKDKRKKWFNLAFFLINILVVIGIFVYQFSTSEVVSLWELFSLKPYYRFLFLSLAIFFVINVIDALKFASLIWRSTGYVRPFLSYKVVALGRYYDCVTPMSTGGQPFQMLYLKNNSVKTEVATAIPLVKYFLWQIAWLIICSCLLIFNVKYYIGNGNVVQIFAWVSLVLNFGLLSLVVMLSVSKKVGPSIVIGILKLLNKMHLIKDYKKTFKKVFKFVREYQKSFKLLIKHFGQVVYHVILNGITIILNSSLAYFVYLAFNIDGGFSFVEILTNVIICELAVGLVPLPGAAGAAEISFAAVFAKYFTSQTLVWGMLFWRIFTYFGYIIQGVIILIYDYAYGNKKAEYYFKNNRFKGNKDYIPYRKREKQPKIESTN